MGLVFRPLYKPWTTRNWALLTNGAHDLAPSDQRSSQIFRSHWKNDNSKLMLLTGCRAVWLYTEEFIPVSAASFSISADVTSNIASARWPRPIRQPDFKIKLIFHEVHFHHGKVETVIAPGETQGVGPTSIIRGATAYVTFHNAIAWPFCAIFSTAEPVSLKICATDLPSKVAEQPQDSHHLTPQAAPVVLMVALNFGAENLLEPRRVGIEFWSWNLKRANIQTTRAPNHQFTIVWRKAFTEKTCWTKISVKAFISGAYYRERKIKIKRSHGTMMAKRGQWSTTSKGQRESSAAHSARQYR